MWFLIICSCEDVIGIALEFMEMGPHLAFLSAEMSLRWGEGLLYASYLMQQWLIII